MAMDHFSLLRQVRAFSPVESAKKLSLEHLSDPLLEGDMLLFLMNALILSICLSFLAACFVLWGAW